MTQLYKIDGVLWEDLIGGPTPFCPRHRLEMDAYTLESGKKDHKYDHLWCEECEMYYQIPRDINDEKIFIKRKLRSKNLKDAIILNFDDEAVPIAEAKASSKNEKFFVKAILTDSKVGKRLVVYAGEKGKKEKTQIFIEPNIKRLAFDQKDTHPSEVFVALDAIFADGTRTTISRKRTRK